MHSYSDILEVRMPTYKFGNGGGGGVRGEGVGGQFNPRHLICKTDKKELLGYRG